MIVSPIFQNRSYLVVGLGVTGRATIQSLQASGARVYVWDDQPSSDIPLTLLDKINWANLDALILSPGIPHLHPVAHPSAERARAAGIPILCDIDLLAQACPDNTFIGITGTNGKSTTTALIGHMLKIADLPLQIGGNIGTPALALEGQKKGIYVLELSSYQLERVPHLILEYGILLNITPDHLTRHGGMEGYQQAKKEIFTHPSPSFQGIISIDDPFCQALYHSLKENLSLKTVSEHSSADYEIRQGMLWEKGRAVFDLSTHAFLRGSHNHQNLAAAYALGRLMGIESEKLKQGLLTFKGLAHRLEILEPIEQVMFVNDSKATNAMAAAKGLACFKDIYWIVGGQAKENGLEGLEAFYPRIRHAFLIGEAAQSFAQVFDQYKVPYTICETLERAVPLAFERAYYSIFFQPVVLLAPACASWDQFRNFEDRGETFRQAVDGLRRPKSIS